MDSGSFAVVQISRPTRRQELTFIGNVNVRCLNV